MISTFTRRLLGVASAALVIWSIAFVLGGMAPPFLNSAWPAIRDQRASATIQYLHDFAVMGPDILLAQGGARGSEEGVLVLSGSASSDLHRNPAAGARSQGRGKVTTTAAPVSTAVTVVETVSTTSVVETTTTPGTSTSTSSATTVTTAASSNAPPGAVEIRPSDDVASIVNGTPEGTVFFFRAGVYSGLSIRPKANMVFQGEPGAILRGQGRPYAFSSGSAGVTIRGLTIEGYSPSEKAAAIYPEGGAKNWTIEGNEIRNNDEVGVKANHGWRISNNYIHHNGRYGITGSGSNIAILGNEIAYNSTDYGATGSSGGTKFVHTTGLLIRGNYVHHNFGNGLWVDINNVRPLIEDNRVAANERNGIFIEISCGGTIRNNRVEGNGTKPKYENWMGGSSGILVSMSPDVEVYGNTLSGNAKGIGAVHWDHANVGSVTSCNPQLRNLRVHNNQIAQSGGAAAGIDASKDESNVFGSWDNRFSSNTYKLSNGAQFRWAGEWISFEEWKAIGQE